MTELEAKSLLAEYARTRSRELEETLVLIYSPHAINTSKFFVSTNHRDDAKSAAMEGLLLALRTFNPDKGTKFTTHLTNMVRRSVKDEIRVSLRTRKKVKEYAVSACPELPRGTYQELLDKLAPSTANGHALTEAQDSIMFALAALELMERYVVIEYHLKHRKLGQIADSLRFSTSWISLVKKRALGKMREVLDERGENTA